MNWSTWVVVPTGLSILPVPNDYGLKQSIKQKTEHTTMKFLSLYKTAETGLPPTPEELSRMGKLIEERMKAGFLVAVEGCMPSATGARVRLSNGKLSVTDGP